MVKNTLNYQEVPMQFSFPHLTLKSQKKQPIYPQFPVTALNMKGGGILRAYPKT